MHTVCTLTGCCFFVVFRVSHFNSDNRVDCATRAALDIAFLYMRFSARHHLGHFYTQSVIRHVYHRLFADSRIHTSRGDEVPSDGGRTGLASCFGEVLLVWPIKASAASPSDSVDTESSSSSRLGIAVISAASPTESTDFRDSTSTQSSSPASSAPPSP